MQAALGAVGSHTEVLHSASRRKTANNVAEGREQRKSAARSVRFWRGAEERQQQRRRRWTRTSESDSFSSQTHRISENEFLLIVVSAKTAGLKPEEADGSIRSAAQRSVSLARPGKSSAVSTMHPDQYLPELVTERNGLEPSFVHAVRLLEEEIEKCEGGELRNDGNTKKYLDIISNKNIKLSERVLIPVQQYPKFNFVGKLLGPRGNSMKRLQEETGVKMSILGKGSMRDKGKEEELRKSGEAKYAHLSNELHVLIEVFAPPGEAYSRMSHALEEIKKFLVPDYNDEIRQEQLRELSYLNGSNESSRGRSAQGRSSRPASTASTRGQRGTGRSAAAPRGTTGSRKKPSTTALTRDVQQAPRARSAAGNTGYRPPLLPLTQEAYDDYVSPFSSQ
ncbi:hypothetical protein LDENG_00080140 [Lucifuga dentata]|nr:hypothetical protein LDENG_00080140 [Lucifuga dentata]